MKTFWNPDCLLHNPSYGIFSGKKVPYYESPARLQLIKKELEEHPSSFTFELASTSASGSSESQDFKLDISRYVQMVHGHDYLRYLSNAYDNWVRSGGSADAVQPDTFPHPRLLPEPSQTQVDSESLSPIAKAGYYGFGLSGPITKTTYSSAIASVGVALSAAQELATASQSDPHGPKTGVFALCRPPGHHAGTSLCGGYCFINNVAVAARFLQSLSPRAEREECVPIAILDIDYHHGNGTQEIFYSDSSVVYVSLHAENDYPYFTGTVTEKGIDEGANTNFNYPLPRGTQDSDYCATLRKATEDIRMFDPVYLLVSLGVDTFAEDPISHFKLSHSCYTVIGQVIADLRKPTLFVMEGGYHMETLGQNVRAVLQGFEQRLGGGSNI